LEGERFAAVGRLVEGAPAKGGAKLGMMPVAALLPEAVQRHVVRRAAWVVGRTLAGAESGVGEVETPGLRLALGEEGKPDAAAAIGRQKHALAEIEEICGGMAGGEERRLHLVRLRRHRRAGRGADDLAPVERQHEDRAFRAPIGGKVGPLIGKIAIVEIGKVAEDGDPEPRDVVKAACRVRSRKGFDFQRHGHFQFDSVRVIPSAGPSAKHSGFQGDVMTATDTIRAYYDAFNAQDMDAFLALLTDDVVHDINQGERQVGKDAFAAFMAHMNHCYRERLTDRVVMTSEDGTRESAEFIVNGEYLATDEGLPEAN